MNEDLFATTAEAQLSGGLIDGRIPYLTIDGIFADPSAVRAAALALPYSSGTAHYPGRVARFPAGDSSCRRRETANHCRKCAASTLTSLSRINIPRN